MSAELPHSKRFHERHKAADCLTGSSAQRPGAVHPGIGTSGGLCFSLKLPVRGGHDMVRREPEFLLQFFERRRCAK